MARTGRGCLSIGFLFGQCGRHGRLDVTMSHGLQVYVGVGEENCRWVFLHKLILKECCSSGEEILGLNLGQIVELHAVFGVSGGLTTGKK